MYENHVLGKKLQRSSEREVECDIGQLDRGSFPSSGQTASLKRMR